MPRPSNPSHRRLSTGHGSPAHPHGLPARDAFRAVGRALMGGLVGVLIDALWPPRGDGEAGHP